MIDSTNLRINPRDIKDHLDEYVIGQDEAKQALAVAVNRHYRRIRIRDRGKGELDKSNILLIGPTGCGKTYLVQTLARILEVPLVTGDANEYSAAGYVGGNVSALAADLLRSSDDDSRLAERGIIYIDEIDKLAHREMAWGHVGTKEVQDALLKLVEGTEYRGKSGSFNTRTVLFIVSGAFSGLEHFTGGRDNTRPISARDLISYGMQPEFIGRFPQVIQVRKLTEDELVRILIEPRNAPLRQLKIELAEEGLELKVRDRALKLLAAHAAERDLGARTLTGIIDTVTQPILFQIEDYRAKGKPVVIDPAFVKRRLAELAGDDHRDAPPPPVSFRWDGGEQVLPVGAGLAFLNKAPDPLLAKLLASKMLLGKPNVQYKVLLEELRLTDYKRLFTKLAALQRWCLNHGYFDLTALVVGRSGAPGKGFYHGYCQDEYQWRKYLAAANKVLL